ncbi:hypothetical protein BP6252_13214 [Coleophoma cylindrospora]|uniref:Uncharacterized protein n=1 Tax=Coleophoma cylindrospora TaxID=1849047 RepID=A0A3D8QAU6_9HELO|nr:hypothetical protein BP6252_13214 [Coleophoma cylindrospora]
MDKGGTQHSNVNYMITCRDFELRRVQQFYSNKNVFEDQKLQLYTETRSHRNKKTSAVLEVFVEVNGFGGSPDWAPDPKFTISPPRNDEIGLEYDEPRLIGSVPVESNMKMHTAEQLGEILESFQASSMKTIAVHIHSYRLQECLRSLTSNYPIPAFNANPIIINHPMEILVQNFVNLENMAVDRQDKTADHSTTLSSRGVDTTLSHLTTPFVCDEATRHDLNVLLDFIKPIYYATIEPSKKRQDAGLVTYDMLWLLFVRGSYVADLMPPVVEERKKEFEIRPFKGERDIESLPVFPAESYDLKYPNVKHDLESRDDEDGQFQDEKDLECPPVLASFDYRKRPVLKPHEYLLLQRSIVGYALRSKTWMNFDVECISKIEWQSSAEEIMSRIILPPRDIEIIQALSQPFQSGQPDFWRADFIAGKGEARFPVARMDMEGPPGTGKTYTVECVAESTRTPLLSLTVADIATSWGAIILIDEADIFLEKRRVEADALKRNSLVSVFLRCLEYHKGIIFLTTNRIGHIDDAFLSRTSVAVTFPVLNAESQQRIWENFIKKLRKERTDIVITPRAVTYVTESEDMQGMPWNGREIRNALQAAIALARYQTQTAALPLTKIEVDMGHFYTVVHRRKKFFEYRDRISGMDKQKRAYLEKSRAPLVTNTPKF